MARPRNLELHELWRGRIRRQVESGTTITQCCAREGLSINLCHAWKRRVRLIDLANHPATPVASAPPAFLPVAIHVPEHMLGEHGQGLLLLRLVLEPSTALPPW
jgi:hypothetical protein